ncbi:MAG: hypothetical protein CL726_07020, partial [Chloroflexi bacterium]|nr:hypothetical protein [Chloroflexota bacterium]
MRTIGVVLLLGLFGLFAFAACSDDSEDGAVEETAVELQVPVAFGTNLPSLGDGILYISERIEQLSGGSLTMTVYEPGKLVAANEILDSVS